MLGVNSLLISKESSPVAPSVETEAVAAAAGATVGVKILAVGFKTPVGLKLKAFKLLESSAFSGLNS